MKTNEKIMMGLASLAIVATPIAAVISCGKNKATNKETNSNDARQTEGKTGNNSNAKETKKKSPYDKSLINEFIKNRFSKRLSPTTITGAIAQTSDRYKNPVYPMGFKGKTQKHDIVLTSEKAEAIIKKSIKEDGFAYLIQDNRLKQIDNIAEKAFLKLNKFQYYAVASWALKIENAASNNSKTQQPQPDVKINPKKIGDITYNTGDVYYAAAKGLKGEALMKKLHEIQGQHIVHRGYGQLYDTYKKAFLDDIYDKDKTFIDIYSENPTGKDPYNYILGNNDGNYHVEGDMYNREHVIPQSWFGKKSPMRNDAQFVWPTDGKVNGMRSNYPHALANNASFTSKNGSKLGTNANYGGQVFEPIDEFKGDIARAYLYFALSYHERIVSHVQAKKVFTPAFPFIHNNFLKLYIKWAKEDPVDKFDIQRNREVAKIQGNRNPFVDYPELIDEIWGNDGDGNPTKTFTNNGVAMEIK
ncbi:endonuclease [Mycoplasma todarodis]|nr:endonuclease [Mycoplasma todarodis]